MSQTRTMCTRLPKGSSITNKELNGITWSEQPALQTVCSKCETSFCIHGKSQKEDKIKKAPALLPSFPLSLVLITLSGGEAPHLSITFLTVEANFE